MGRMSLALALALASAVTLGAQETKVKSETEVKIKGGQEVKLTGCLQPDANETGGFTLGQVRGGPATTYVLVGGDRKDLAKNIGRLVEVKGKIADADHGKVEMKTKTKVDHDPGDDHERHSETTLKGDALAGMPFFGVKSVKVLNDSCTVATTGR